MLPVRILIYGATQCDFLMWAVFHSSLPEVRGGELNKQALCLCFVCSGILPSPPPPPPPNRKNTPLPLPPPCSLLLLQKEAERPSVRPHERRRRAGRGDGGRAGPDYGASWDEEWHPSLAPSSSMRALCEREEGYGLPFGVVVTAEEITGL